MQVTILSEAKTAGAALAPSKLSSGRLGLVLIPGFPELSRLP